MASPSAPGNSNSSKVLRFTPAPPPVAAPPPVSMAERLLFLFTGGLIVLFCWGLIVLLLFIGGMFRLGYLVVLLPLFLFGLFGANWMIQSAVGRSRHEGVFYSLLGRMAKLGPPVWSLFVPSVAGLSLLLSALLRDAEGIQFAGEILLMWGVVMLSVGVHELGHIVAARFVQAPLARILVGPMELLRRREGWRFEISRDWLSLVGGLVVTATPLSARRSLIFASGGPVASLLLVLVFMAAPWRALSTPGILIGLGILVVNLIPSRNLAVGMPSDGYQILQAWRELRGR